VWHNAAYRSGQFFRGFRWALCPDEIHVVRSLLTDREVLLFTAMQGRDRRHSMDMVRWLERHALSMPSDTLLAAALLHDVGKGSLIVWDRVAFVLLGAVSQRLRRWLGREDGWRWQHALWRLEHHARIGAEMLTAAGTDPRVVELVGRHKDAWAGDDEELRLLMAADGAC
jgi:putative nucleotidyltransferase with HDIG domain